MAPRTARSVPSFFWTAFDDVTALESAVEDLLAMSQSVPLNRVTFFAYIFPPFACQYLMGVLVQLEGTGVHRLALLPVLFCLTWRATFVDMSGGDPTKTQANSQLVTQMCSMATRSAVWALARVRYQRHFPVIHGRDGSALGVVKTACWNTWDLMINPRGIGWNWPRGLVVPKLASGAESRLAFTRRMATGFLFNVLAFDACVQLVRAMGTETFGSLKGGTLFDHTLPPVLELSRAVLVSFLAASSAYFGIQYTYKFLAIVFVVAFRQHAAQWPPLFDAPWASTSLSELWGWRWHQMMRDMLMTLGYGPFERVLGPLGGVLGAFLVSGVFHNLELGRSGHTVVVVGFWVMNGVGVVLERAWKRATGKRVGGAWGRVWMVVWLTAWGVPMGNVYAKVGRFGALSVVGGFEPSLALLALLGRFVEVARS